MEEGEKPQLKSGIKLRVYTLYILYIFIDITAVVSQLEVGTPLTDACNMKRVIYCMQRLKLRIQL